MSWNKNPWNSISPVRVCVCVCVRVLLLPWTWHRWHQWILKWFGHSIILLAMIQGSVCVGMWLSVNALHIILTQSQHCWSDNDEGISPQYNPQHHNRHVHFPSLSAFFILLDFSTFPFLPARFPPWTAFHHMSPIFNFYLMYCPSHTGIKTQFLKVFSFLLFSSPSYKTDRYQLWVVSNILNDKAYSWGWPI